MRKMLMALLPLTMLFACSKQEQAVNSKPVANGQKSHVSFNVSDFLKKYQAMPSPYGRTNAADTSTANITDLYYIVINNNGYSIADTAHQHVTDANFGTYSTYMVDGNFSIQVLATDRTLNNFVYITHTVDGSYAAPQSAYPDMFTGVNYFTVNSSDTTGNNLDINMELDRLNGMLEFDINDVQDDSLVTVTLFNEVNVYDFWHMQGANTSDSIQLTHRAHGVFSDFVLNTASALSAVIRYPDANTGAMTYRTVNNIKVDRNTKTVLSGNIYGPSAPGPADNAGFSVHVNGIWNPIKNGNF